MKPEENSSVALEAELANLRAENARLQSENGRLLSENVELANLRAENARLQSVSDRQDSKIIELLRMVGADTLDEEVLNKRAFDQVLEQKYQEAVDEKKRLSVVVIDLDQFKAINDTYGHEAGNKIILDVLGLLKNSLRTKDNRTAEQIEAGVPPRELDIVARTGGDEISVILPGTSIEDAVVVMQRIRKALIGTSLSVLGTQHDPITVSGSIGLASIDQGSQDGVELHSQADKAMYAAKHAGKNTIAVYASDEDGGSFVIPDAELNKRVMSWVEEGLPDIQDQAQLLHWLQRKIRIPELSYRRVVDDQGKPITYAEQLDRTIKDIYEVAVYTGNRPGSNKQDNAEFLKRVLYSHYAVVRNGVQKMAEPESRPNAA